MARSAEELFEHFKNVQYKDKTVEINGQDYYVVEGDLLLSERKLRAYAIEREEIEAGDADTMAEERQGLVARTDLDGRVVRWRPGLVLTYAVSKATFPGNRYDMVVQATANAASNWAAVCGVEFKHLSHLDEGADGEEPLFWVRGVNTNGKFIAVAFFPDDPVEERQVIIDPIFFSPTLSYSPVGVLRHELGHVLGFRHEHIRSGAPPDCRDENLDYTFELTPYDPTSVMHYPCGQKGSTGFQITAVDRAGAVAVYGPPHRAFQFFG